MVIFHSKLLVYQRVRARLLLISDMFFFHFVWMMIPIDWLTLSGIRLGWFYPHGKQYTVWFLSKSHKIPIVKTLNSINIIHVYSFIGREFDWCSIKSLFIEVYWWLSHLSVVIIYIYMCVYIDAPFVDGYPIYIYCVYIYTYLFIYPHAHPLCHAPTCCSALSDCRDAVRLLWVPSFSPPRRASSAPRSLWFPWENGGFYNEQMEDWRINHEIWGFTLW